MYAVLVHVVQIVSAEKLIPKLCAHAYQDILEVHQPVDPNV